ncbi:MAG: ATP-binding cassette domain-containing protein, partial [Candidatus Sumerlaeia bacterium]|nr:ATP-binding cassette domain-containing protein [Candidatus Sumerlaeia bacterium]
MTLSPDSTTVLEVAHVSKNFGGVRAVSDVSLTVPRGQIVSLIGPNGAGKTTLFNTITGLFPATSGEIHFVSPLGRRARLTRRRPDRITRLGIARTFQNIRLFGNMTALENVMVGRHLRTSAGVVGAVLRDRATREEE